MVFHFGWTDREGGTEGGMVGGLGWAGRMQVQLAWDRIGHCMREWDLETGPILAGNTPTSMRIEEMEDGTAAAWA